MKKLLTILGAVMMTAAGLKAQFSFTAENATTTVQFVPCGQPDTLQISITAAGSQTSAQVGVKLPTNGVFASHVSGGTLLSSSLDSFTVDLGNMTSGQTIILRYRVRMNCLGASSPAFNAAYRATSTTHNSTHIGQSYASSVFSPVLQFLAVDIDTSGLAEGGIHTRKYTIANSSASAISYFDTIYFRGKYKTGEAFVDLKVGSTTVTPTQSGDSLLYAIAGTMLDADSRLNGGQSILVEERVQVTNQCALVNATTDAVQAYYGCFATRGCTAPVQLNAVTQVAPTLNQLVTASTTARLAACQGEPDTLFFMVVNPASAGKARDIRFNIESNFADYNFDSRQTINFFLGGSIQSTYNGAPYNILKDTLQVLQKHEQLIGGVRTGAPLWYATVPNDAIYNIRFRLDSMNPGDTLRGSMLYSMLCDSAAMVDHIDHYWRISSPGYGSWSQPGLKNLTSRNNCNTNNVVSHPGTQSNRAPMLGNITAYWRGNTIGNIVGTENYYPAQSGNARISMASFEVSSGRLSSRSIYEARIILPVGLVPTSLVASNYRVRNLVNDAIVYTAYKATIVGNELRLSFRFASPISLSSRYLDIPLSLDCGLLTGPKTDSIQCKWYARVDSTCTSGCGFLNFARTSNLPVALHCPGSLPDGGLEGAGYNHRRWNMGLADYDNNGIPDGTGLAHPDSVNLSTFMLGDTMYTFQKGRVVVTGSTPGGAFTHGYSVQRFILPAASQLPASQANFQPEGAKLTVYSNATATTYTVNALMPTRHRFGDTVYYIYHLSNDSLRGKGSIPMGFSWANGDSISLESYTRFRTNGSSNEDVYVINQENDIYMATNAITTTSTSSINNHTRYTNQIKSFETDIYRLLNLSTINGSVNFVTINTCIANSFYDQASAAGLTQREYNRTLFLKEYRPLHRPLFAQVTIPRKGVEIDSIRFSVSNTNSSTGGLTVIRVPAAALTMRYDSGFARIDLQQVFTAMGRSEAFDEGYTTNFRMHFKRNGAVLEQNPNSFTVANRKVGLEYDAAGTTWADLINPFSGSIGRHNWYPAGAGESITRFLNPNYDGSALGAVSKTIAGQTTTFDARLANATGAQQMDVDSAWVYFVSTSGAIKLKGATNIATSAALPVANGKLIRIGSLAAGQSRDIRLDVEFADGCGTDSFKLLYSWNCPGITSPAADSVLRNFAIQDSTTHTITKFDPILENTTSISRTSNIALCDTILVSTLVNNAGGGIGYKIDFTTSVPNFGTGIELVPGSFRLRYPSNSASPVSIPAPTAVGGGQYKWTNINQYITALDTGGLAAFTDPVNNKMSVSYQVRFTCGFNSGLTLSTLSQASCGTAGTSSFTSPIRLKAENQAVNQFYTCETNADTVNTCGLASANTLRTVFTNLSASANPSGANDSIFIYLPAGVTYNSGVSATPRAPDRAIAQPDGRQRLSWRVNGVARGASATFTYGVTGNDTLSCNVIQIQNQSGAFVQDTCILDGSLCLTGVIKSDVNSNLTIQKPAINLTAATATSVYNATTPVNEIVTINYTVSNSGTASTSHQIRSYHDADASGTFTPGDVLVNTRTINTNIANGGTHSGTFNLDLLSSQTCPLVLVIEQSACQCSRSQRAINNIKLNNAGLDSALCHGSSIVIGTGTGPSAYTYAWSPATDLSSTTISNPTLSAVNLTGSNIVNTYILTTTRNSVTSCTNLDTVVITERPLPTIAVLRDTSICLGQSVTYTQSGGGTYAWNTLPVQTTAAITVAPTANTEYRVTVTSANGCQRSDTAVVSLRATPTANAGGPKSRVNCVGDSVQVGSAAIASHTYTWSPATGLSATNIAMPWAKPTVTTTYRMTITNTLTGCTSVDSAVVTVNASSLVANAGNDATVCQGAPIITVGASPTASGGNTPYTYAWSPAAGLSSTSTANPTAATTTAAVTNYALMLTDGRGCIARDTVRVTINARPTVAPSATPATVCNGASSTIAANATGGTTPYTYTWTPAGSGASHSQSPVSTTNYGVTVSDANSCTASGTVTLNVTGTSPLVANAGNARAICNGASANLGGSPTASGGSGAFTYAWSSSPAGFTNATANPSASPTATTTYTVTVTSAGCTATNTVVVTVNPRPSVAPSATPAAICNGQSSTIAANATGGTAPLTYSWSPNGAGASHSQTPAATTSYSVTVTDANMCTAAGSVTVNVTGTSPLVANAGTARTICNGASTTLGGTPTGSGGTGTYTYAWSGGAGTTANPVVTPTATTTYTVTVTSSTCTVSSSVIVTVNPTPTVAPSASATTICNGQSVTINANAAGGTGTLTYTWNDGAGASHVKSPTANTTYLVTVSDANSCTATGSVSVTVTGSTPLAANAGSARAICNGASTSLGGVPTATGGAGGYTYAWSGGAGTTANPTVSPTATTTYTVTVTSSGCTVSSSVIVTVNPRPSVAPSATPATICNGQSTTIAANATGGTAPLSYTWSPSGSGASFTLTPSTTTPCVLTVSDANGCTATGSVTVNVTGLSPLVANAGAARTICSGASTGLGAVPTATGGSGGYTYAWSGGASAVANPTVSPTTTTTYTVTVTSSGCTATSSVVVTVNPSPTTAPSVSATTICNGQSVTVNANATGGTAPLNYTWNDGAGASHTKSPTANTTYLVTVSDANSCTATGSVSVTVTGSTPLASNAGAARAICNGASTTLGGTPTATGGAGGYTYAWSGGAGTTANPTVSPTATTTYTVTVTSSGCTVSSSVIVTVNPRPSVAPSATPAALCNGESTTIAANATGGTAPLTFAWSIGGSSASFTATPASTTSYSVTVTDANGCTASGSVTVNVTGTSPLVAVAGSARAICNGGSTALGGSPTASGGAGGYTYVWSGGAGNTANPVVSPSATTTYTVTVTSSGCTATSSVVVTVNSRPNVAPSATVTNVCFGGSSTVSANGSGGTAPLTYNWSPSGSGASFVATPNASTIYNVTATDANGCTASGNVSVNVIGSSPLTVNAGTNRTICNGSSTNLGATPTGNGGNTSGTYAYSWSSNPAGFTSTAANPTVSPSATTTYTVTVTNSTCTATNTVVISVNPRPAAAPSASVNPVCSGSNSTITANASGGTSPYTYQWNTSQTSASFVASPTTTAPIVNAYTVTVTDVNGCTISSTVNVSVTPLPVVAAIANQSMCIPSTGGSVALNAAALTAGQTGAWTTVTSPSGAVSFSTPTAASTNVSTLTPINTYTFRWTLTQSGCSNSTTTNVTVNESPVIEAGANDTICLNTSKTLSASLTSVSPAAINWKANTISSTPFAFTTSTTVAPTTTTRYIFTAAISPCIVSDTVVVAVIGVPNLVDDLATCLSATEDIATTFNIPTTIGSNDALGLVLRGGVTYKVLSSKNSTATVSGTTLNYASNLNFYGKDTVVIEAYSNECTPLRDTAMFCVDVAGVNDKPVLAPDTVKAVGTNPKTFNPLANDSDIETTLKGGNITVLSGPNSGTLTGPAADGTFTYTGNSSNLATLDTIVYQVCDSGLPMPAQCDVSRIIVQLVPEIKDSTAVTTPGNPVVLGPAVTTGPGVTMTPKLIGAGGTNGTTITTPSGTATINPTTGVMTFTPNDTPFIGKDTVRKVLCFTYPDGSEACDTSIFVVSNPSVTNTSSDSTPMNTPKVVGTLKPYKFEGGVATTTTTPNAIVDPVTGAVTYTPKPGFVGVDTVKVTRCDSKGNCVTDLFIMTVTPSLPDTSVTAIGTTPINLGPAIVGGNGTTVETTIVGPSNGTVTKNADGTITYVPSGSYVGRDTITRIVKVTYPDGTVKYDTQTIVVKNTIPDVINPDGDIIVKQDETKDIGTLPKITFEGSPVTTTITSSAGGTATVDSNGKITYKPKPGFFGTDTIKIVRCDNLGNCVTSIFIVKVEEVVSDIPNYFSPNGDGINDVWNLDGLLGRYPNAKAIIYNRWGNVVWRSTGPYGRSTSGTNVWFGQAEGSQDNVPDGVYYYLLELEDDFKTTKTGFIEVMRQ